jgi:putative transposase
LKQYGNTYKILDYKYIKIQGVKQNIRVRGLKQILVIVSKDTKENGENIEVANADFINKHGDFYLHIVTYQDKKVVDTSTMLPKEIKEPKSIGLDFGIAEQITLSNGIRINYRIPISDKLRKLYKKLSRKEYHSHNWEKIRLKIRKEFDKLTNIKGDIKNKIVHRLGEYQIVCYQDDNIKSWQRIWGRRILETSIGGIKSDIDKKIQTPVEVGRFFPSTKKCSECGHEREIGLDERIYECLNPKCQIKKDRDWNSSINIKIEGLRLNKNNSVDTGRIDFKPAEIGSSTLDMEYFNHIPYVKASSVRETGSLTALA